MMPIKTLPVDKVIEAAKIAALKTSEPLIVDGVRLKRSQNLTLFMTKGTTCVCCGKPALYFQVIENKQGKGKCTTVILVVEPPSGNRKVPNILTKDHIIAKSRGGPNEMDNYQPMCQICNLKKGNKVDHPTIPDELKNNLLYNKESIKTPTVVPTPIPKPKVPKVSKVEQNLVTIKKARKFPLCEYQVLHYEACIRWYISVFFKTLGHTQVFKQRDEIWEFASRKEKAPHYSAFLLAYNQIIESAKQSGYTVPASYIKQTLFPS